MSRATAFVAALAAVTLISAASASAAIAAPTAPRATVRTSGHPFDAFNDGIFGCNITISARNEGNSAVTINLNESRAKLSLGLWNRMNGQGTWTINVGGAVQSKVVELAMMCDAGRRLYEFRMLRGGNEKIVPFPPSGDPTSDQSIGLGNVARHF